MLVNNSKQYKHVFECDDMLKSASASVDHNAYSLARLANGADLQHASVNR